MHDGPTVADPALGGDGSPPPQISSTAETPGSTFIACISRGADVEAARQRHLHLLARRGARHQHHAAAAAALARQQRRGSGPPPRMSSSQSRMPPPAPCAAFSSASTSLRGQAQRLAFHAAHRR